MLTDRICECNALTSRLMPNLAPVSLPLGISNGHVTLSGQGGRSEQSLLLSGRDN
jgi:hypothetical protein